MIWYPDEEICHWREMQKKHKWIRLQRQIANIYRKRAKKNPKVYEEYFSFKRLSKMRRVSSRIRGETKWKLEKVSR